jgi:serine/threonine-protein kinase
MTAMALNNGCDPRRLDLLLHDRLPGESARDLEAHLHGCPSCRQKLDELAGGPRWWTEVRRHLGGDGAAELARTAEPAATPAGWAQDLEFLLPSDQPGSLGRLGNYEVLEVLGRGGFGVVLKAFDPGLHRPVAIKVLAAEYAARGAARKRFAREARAAAAVAHEHVVPVHAVDADATPPYLVMAFIPGESLQERLDRTGPLELREVLRIGMQTASGLSAAHAQGLVHRDIKPANIMLENGIERVRITDFGLARAVDDASVTQSGAVAGTPQYMSPEQAAGEPVDQRADLFALGSTLYAMCTGNAPFRGDSGWAVLRKVCDDEPEPIRWSNPDVPAWLEGVVRKLHAKDPAQRFASASEVADLLEGCLAHVQQPDRHPLPARAGELARLVPRPAHPHPEPRRRRPLPALLALVALVGIGLLFLPRPGPGPRGPGLEGPGNGPAQPPGPDARGPLPDRDLGWDPAELRKTMGEVRQALTPFPAVEVPRPDPVLQEAHRRAGQLQHELGTGAEPGPDPVDEQLQSIRRRLEQVRQRIDGQPE